MSTRGGSLWAVLASVVCALPVAGQEVGDPLGRMAHLEIRDVQLVDALQTLQRSSGVPLAFSQDVLPSGRAVSCSCRRVSVAQALIRMLSGTDLVFERQGRQVLIGRRRTAEPEAPSTERRLRGIVVDAVDGRPVPAADISLTPGGRRTLTGDDGRFVYDGLPAGAYEVTVEALGYAVQTKGVTVGVTDDLRLEMLSNPIPLGEITIAPGAFGVLEGDLSAGGTAISRDEIEATPQLGDDVFRTLKRMPGVSADDVSTRLNVRGGTDRDLLVRLDGLELYEPYHLKDLDGALGIVDVQSLGSVKLITGGFPADFGDRTAGVFDMRTRTPPPGGDRTTVSLSLSSLSYNGQHEFAEGRGEWLASLRRGFLEYVLAVGGVEDDISPTYWDALGKVRYLLSDRHSITVEGLYAGDGMRYRDENADLTIRSRWSSAYGWVTWKATLAMWLRSETLVSVGRLRRKRDGAVHGAGRSAFAPASADVDDVADSEFLGVRQDWQVDLAEDLLLRAGVEHRADRAEYDYASEASFADVDDTGRIYTRTEVRDEALTPAGAETGAYVSLRSAVPGGLTLEGGVRFDRYGHTNEEALSPRLLARFDVGDETTLRGSWGRYTRSQGVHELGVQDGETAFSRTERAEQLAVGLERRMSSEVTARIEAYRRLTRHPRPEFVNLAREVIPLYEVLADRRRLDPAKVRAEGVELFVSAEGTGALSASGSYALARSDFLLDGAWVPRTLDQRHTLNLFAVYRLGDAWQVSSSWQYHTGWPYTNQFLDLVVGPAPGGGETVEIVRRGFGPVNRKRLPSYHRLDVRIQRAFRFRRSRLEIFLDVFNVYDRTNLRGYEWGLSGSNGTYSAYRDSGEEQLPIMPTLGFRWVF